MSAWGRRGASMVKTATTKSARSGKLHTSESSFGIHRGSLGGPSIARSRGWQSNAAGTYASKGMSLNGTHAAIGAGALAGVGAGAYGVHKFHQHRVRANQEKMAGMHQKHAAVFHATKGSLGGAHH